MKTCFFKMALPVAVAAFMLTSCSDDEPEAPKNYYRVIGFENADGVLAGPTSYGENLYATYDGTRFITGSEELMDGVDFQFGINEDAGEYNFWNGGVVRSQWNYRTDIEGKTEGWWMTYSNQCSVYNTASVDGSNKGAGADGSNTFAVINGYNDGNFNHSAASMSFSGGKEYVIEDLMYCPTSYLYGVMTNGSAYSTNPGMSLESVRGWFKMTVTGYDAAGNVTSTVDEYVADFRDSERKVEIPTTWTPLNLTGLGKVNKIVFNFTGSDTGAYGMNTPAYMAIDNIKVRMN